MMLKLSIVAMLNDICSVHSIMILRGKSSGWMMRVMSDNGKIMTETNGTKITLIKGESRFIW